MSEYSKIVWYDEDAKRLTRGVVFTTVLVSMLGVSYVSGKAATDDSPIKGPVPYSLANITSTDVGPLVDYFVHRRSSQRQTTQPNYDFVRIGHATLRS